MKLYQMFSINSMRDAELHNVHLIKSSATGKLKVMLIKLILFWLEYVIKTNPFLHDEASVELVASLLHSTSKLASHGTKPCEVLRI